jgi:hypothetical protein
MKSGDVNQIPPEVRVTHESREEDHRCNEILLRRSLAAPLLALLAASHHAHPGDTHSL